MSIYSVQVISSPGRLGPDFKVSYRKFGWYLKVLMKLKDTFVWNFIRLCWIVHLSLHHSAFYNQPSNLSLLIRFVHGYFVIVLVETFAISFMLKLLISGLLSALLIMVRFGVVVQLLVIVLLISFCSHHSSFDYFCLHSLSLVTMRCLSVNC